MENKDEITDLLEEDFGFQYLRFNDQLISEYINSVKAVNPEYLLYNGFSIEGIIEKRLFAKLIYDQKLRATFNKYWKNNTMSDSLKKMFFDSTYGSFILKPSEIKNLKVAEKSLTNIDIKEKIKGILDPFKGKIVYYAYNLRFLEIALPILAKLKEDVIILTYEDIPESKNYPDNIIILEFPVLKTKEFHNAYLELKFPLLYYLFNNLEFLIRILKPKSIIIFEGANVVEYGMLAVIGKKFKITTICVQHGWPGILYSGFQNMQFDYFLSWGQEFTKLLAPLNPLPNFISTGYPYKAPKKLLKKKDAISFFFQGPYFVSTPIVVNEMINFAIFCANKFPEIDILIREHPSSKINSSKMQNINCFKNIAFVPASKISLNKVLERSIVSVSVFSSTLMESLAYNSIPFIFNLTSMPQYYPDLDQKKIGIEIKTMSEAKKKIVGLLMSNSEIKLYRNKITKIKTDYFASNGSKSVQNIVREILKISNQL